MTVNQLLKSKGCFVWAVTPETSVFEALRVMAEKNVGALVVLEGAEIRGIFSERDYARKVILHGKSSKDTPVCEIMTEKVDCVSPSDSVRECMARMTDKHFRHLPVIQGNRVIGLISIGDVVKAIISDQEFMIEQLETYIAGGRY